VAYNKDRVGGTVVPYRILEAQSGGHLHQEVARHVAPRVARTLSYSFLSEMARSGLTMDATYLGQIMAPWQRKLTTSPSARQSAAFARISAGLDSQGVMSWLYRCLDGLMAFDRPDAVAIDRDLESTAPELDAKTFPRQLERC
jgi:hypothetical protein